MDSPKAPKYKPAKACWEKILNRQTSLHHHSINWKFVSAISALGVLLPTMIINTIQVCLLHWGTFSGIWLCRQKYSLQRNHAISPLSVQRTWCSSKQIWKKLAQCSAFLWRISHIFCSSGGLGLSIEESGPKNSKALQCHLSRGNWVSGLTFVSCYLQSFEACTFHDLFNRFWRKKTSFPDNSLWKQKHVCMYLSLESCCVTTLLFHETMSVFWKISPLRNTTVLCHMYIYTYIYSGLLMLWSSWIAKIVKYWRAPQNRWELSPLKLL